MLEELKKRVSLSLYADDSNLARSISKKIRGYFARNKRLTEEVKSDDHHSRQQKPVYPFGDQEEKRWNTGG